MGIERLSKNGRFQPAADGALSPRPPARATVRSQLLLAAAVFLTALAADLKAQEQPAVTCVPGETKAWRCSRDGSAPQAAPLPELITSEPPATGQDAADVFRLPDPADDPSQSVAPIDALMPMPAAPPPGAAAFRGPDLYTLKIASVSAVNEIPDFVESYGLDPVLVRFMEVVEGDSTRQLILWGRFASPVQASRAIVAMPNAVQAMRPQIAEVAALNAPLRDYPSLLAGAASGTGESPAPGAPVTASPVTTPSAKTDPVVAGTRRSPPGEARPGTAADEAADRVAADSGDRDARPASTGGPARVAAELPVPGASTERPTEEGTQQSREPAPADAEAPRSAPDRTAQAVPAAPGSAAATPAEAEARSTAPAATPPQPAVSSTEGSVSRPARPAAGAATGPSLARDSEPRTVAGTATAPGTRASRPAGRAPLPVPDLPGADALAALDQGGFVIQLTSLADRGLLGLYLRRHALPTGGLLAVPLDEGAGTRILLLKGGYNSLASAEAALTELPDSIRSPWIRTVAPLQKALAQPQDL